MSGHGDVQINIACADSRCEVYSSDAGHAGYLRIGYLRYFRATHDIIASLFRPKLHNLGGIQATGGIVQPMYGQINQVTGTDKWAFNV